MVQSFRPKSVPGATPRAIATTSKPSRPTAAPQRRTPTTRPSDKSLEEAKKLHDATGDEFFGAQLFTPDTQAMGPLIVDHQDVHAHLGANKWAVADPAGAHVLSGNRGGFALSHKPGAGLPQLVLSGFKNIGAAGGGASYAVHSDEAQTVRLGLDAFGANHLAGIAPSMSWSDGTGARAGVGIGLFGAADYSIRLLDIDDNPQAPAFGMAKVEVRRNTNPGIALDPSRATATMGLGAKMSFGTGQETVYHMLMPQQELGALLQRTSVREQGLRGLLARFGAATGATGVPVEMADVHDPLNMLGQSKPLQPGERISDTSRGSKTLGAAPGAWGLRVGFFYHNNEATTCSVERLDATRVQVTIAPQRVDAVSLGIDALLVADARHELSQSKASRHSVIFDLQHGPAWEAYRNLVAHPASYDAEALARVPGVQPVADETTESRMQRDGAGIPRPPMLGHLKIAGIGRHGVSMEQNQELKRGNVNYRTRRLVRDTQTHRLWGGEAHARVDTQLHTRQGPDDGHPEFVAVTLNLAFEYDRLTNGDADWLRNTVQSLSGDDLPTPTAHARGHDYKVAVQRVLTRQDFVHLASCSPEDIRAAAVRFGAYGASLGRIIADIQHHRDNIEALSQTLCDHLARADVPTWTALCHLAPKDTQAAVGVYSDAYADAVTRVREFLLQDAATDPTMRDHAQSRRTIAGLRRALVRALSQVENDTLLSRYEPALQQQHIGRLLAAKASLDDVAAARRVKPPKSR